MPEQSDSAQLYLLLLLLLLLLLRLLLMLGATTECVMTDSITALSISTFSHILCLVLDFLL